MVRLAGIEACIFDAYGTLFDVASAAAHASDTLGNQRQPLAELWRTKQLQYSWLRSLMGRHADFWQVTGDALDYALASLKITDAGLRERLMGLYLRLDAYPDVKDTLTRLKAGGMKLAILSNGDAGDAGGGLRELRTCRHPRRRAVGGKRRHLQAAPVRVPAAGRPIRPRARAHVLLSSNGWDAYAAKANGYRVLWCNRFGQAPERLPEAPDAEIASLAELPEIVGR